MGGRRDGDNSTLKPDLFPGLIAVTQQATNSISVYMYIMKALKCKTLGASVMYIHCTLANIHVYTCIIFIIHSIIMHTRTNA